MLQLSLRDVLTVDTGTTDECSVVLWDVVKAMTSWQRHAVHLTISLRSSQRDVEFFQTRDANDHTRWWSAPRRQALISGFTRTSVSCSEDNSTELVLLSNYAKFWASSFGDIVAFWEDFEKIILHNLLLRQIIWILCIINNLREEILQILLSWSC